MSKMQREKGAQAERKVVDIFAANSVECFRTQNIGGKQIRGDLYGIPGHFPGDPPARGAPHPAVDGGGLQRGAGGHGAAADLPSQPRARGWRCRTWRTGSTS